MDSREGSQNDNFIKVNPDAPDFIKDIPLKEKGINTFDMDVNFTPFNHFTAKAPSTTDGIYPETNFSRPVQTNPSFSETSVAEFKSINDTWHYLHAGFTQLQKPWNVPQDPNFNPLVHEDKFINIRPEYYSYLLGSENEQDMNFRLNRIYTEQKNKDDIKNGGWMGYLTGGALGMATDLTNYIPIVGWVKYAKYGTTLLQSAARAAPGALAFGATSSIGEQLDSINGNWQDALIDTLTKASFATALFSGFGVLSLAVDKAALWELRTFMNDHIKGVGYKLKVDKSDKVIGMEAYDMTNGSLSADVVKLAQDKADSTFSKSGFFKIPYLGQAAQDFLGNRVFGTSIVRLLNSPYETVRAVADMAVDHGIITEGLKKGKPNPNKFFTLMKQTHANIRANEAQINALWLERMGFDLSNYVAQNATKAFLYSKNQAFKILGKDLGDRPYVTREQFFSEIEDVLYNKKTSQHNAVNDAANILRNEMDKSYKEWRIAYNLPEDWMPPRTAEGYLMRVYDTQFLNNNENLWVRVISDYLKEADETIIKHSRPIKDIEELIQNNIEKQKEMLENPNFTDIQKEKYVEELIGLKAKKKALEENIQNAIRTNPELQLHADDWNALSANEANELMELTKKRDIAEKELEEYKKLVSEIKGKISKNKAGYIKAKTVKTGEKNLSENEILEQELKKHEKYVAGKQREYDEEVKKLQELAHAGKVNRRFYSKSPDSNFYVFRDPNERLKLRKTYHEKKGYLADEEQAHEFRKEHAKAYYDTILNQTAEDTINQIMGRFTGNKSENHIMERTLMIPDDILYKNKFMTKDLLAKVANYQSWLARRTHLKNVFQDLSLEGGFEPIIKQLHEEYQANRLLLNNTKERVENKLKEEDLSINEIKKLQKQLDKTNRELNKETKRFNKNKEFLNFVYEKMAGISKLSSAQRAWQSGARSMSVAMNLGFLPFTMITDLSANGLKHGMLPFLRDGVYPLIQSMGGILKTKDSEAFRHAAAAANLALQHLSNATAEKNIGLQTNPYLNMGKIPAALDKVAHVTSNLSLVNFIDNMLQRITAGIAQSEIIRMMHSFKTGKLSKRDRIWLNRYGLDPEKDADLIISQFKQYGGGKTSLGGYQSNFWHWQDLETSNKVSDAVFRATHDTIISANTLDTPFWMDSNGPMGVMGPIFKGFSGWAFSSLNRYVIPFMQKPDSSQFIGVLGMLAAGSLVSPMRRMAKGEDPYPANMTTEQWMYEVISDSSFFSYFMTILNDANVLSKGSLLGDLKNDKYRDRTRAGLLGPVFGNINNMADVVTALASNEMNENDALKMQRMLPPFNLSWTGGMSAAIVKSFGLPKTRSIAHRQKGSD